MKILTKILILLIAFLHAYFMFIEVFLWTTDYGIKTFNTTKDFATASFALAKNQGLYNGFLFAGLLWAVFVKNKTFSKQLSYFFVGCVFIAAIYGFYFTGLNKILLAQALPALIALIGIRYTFK